jgi:hypothetical protein
MTDQQLMELSPELAKAYQEIQVHLENLRAINKDRF